MPRSFYSFLLFQIALLALAACNPGCHYERRKQYLKKVFFTGPIPDGPAIIFIHGTKESVISKMVHTLDYPLGISEATHVKANSVLSRIARSLAKAAPADFPLEHFYFYGWHGKLTFQSRIRAAEKLYAIIRNHKGPLTIITHSHGCNVALYLADLVEQENNTQLSIDKLILLAAPVQEATLHLIHAPLFKEVYSFYSSADIMQIGDPQGLYWESYEAAPRHRSIPFLSKRLFEPAPTIMQARVMVDRQSPSHLYFMLDGFISKLPSLLRLLKKTAAEGGYQRTRNKYIVNIPPCGLPPEILDPKSISGRYIPRSNYHKAQRIKKSHAGQM